MNNMQKRRMRRLFAAKVFRSAELHKRSQAAAHNELATSVAAAPLVMLGPGGDYLTRVELPRVDSTGMTSWFKEVAKALGYNTGGAH